MRTQALAKSALTALLALGTPWSARAADGLPHPGLYVGLHGGYDLVLGDWDLHENTDAGLAPDSGFIGGLRLGVQLTHWLGVEAGLALVPLATEVSGIELSGVALGLRGDLLLSPFEGAWSPHLLAGAGAYHLASGDYGDDTDWEVHWGLGLRGMLTDFLDVRVEARHVLTDSSKSGLASNLELTAGVDLWLWGAEPTPPDGDGDGVPDADDACPLDAGQASASGCPDRDGDGVPDAADACVDRPGSLALRGCPDSDGDGVGDDLDKCVATPGVAAHDGCPPPPPDGDGDGVPDSDDACPDDPGPRHARGCPDQDGDGILDRDDKCPTQPGVAEEKGCLPRVIQRRFSGSVRGINFETGSAAIKKSSHALLDQAVKVFTQYPTLRIEISGHTDDQGEDDMNMRLSDDRAAAVKTYLIDRGIAPERLSAVGFGETKPIATNKTAAGRAQNRRIEFKILGQHP